MKKITIISILLAGLLLLTYPVKAQAGINWAEPNISGDFVYDFREAKFAGGSGIDLAKFGKDIFLIRGEWVIFEDSDINKVGLGLGIDAVKGLKELGVQWIPEAINPSLGVLGLCDLKDSPEFSVGAYLSIVKLEF